jgi:hypothetical protein
MKKITLAIFSIILVKLVFPQQTVTASSPLTKESDSTSINHVYAETPTNLIAQTNPVNCEKAKESFDRIYKFVPQPCGTIVSIYNQMVASDPSFITRCVNTRKTPTPASYGCK